MVDIKRQDLTLQDWTKGISADEFAWGSYLYSEAISSGYSTKGFELGYWIKKRSLNNRTKGYPVAITASWGYGFAAFTKDWRIEMWDMWYGNSDGTWDTDWGGAYYSYFKWGIIWDWYVNWLSYGDYLFWIRQNWVDKIPATWLFTPASEVLGDTDMSTATWWTIGTWWTITDNWAEHTTGNTWTLTYDISSEWYWMSDYLRCAVKITNWTAGSLDVTVGNGTETFSDKAEGWYVATLQWQASTTTLTITPSSSFDGTIEYVNLHLNDTVTTVTIYWWNLSDRHPALVWEWDLYVASGDYINIINLGDMWVTYKRIIDSNYEIVAMNQQAWNIIIWATDWHDSRQYYWNWVDAVATEVIEWKWLIIQSAAGTETLTYVLTTSWATVGTVDGYEYRLYVVSGYQRNLIASKLYQFWSDDYLDSVHYNANKKFDFNDVTDDKWMTIFLDSLYMPGCDWIYKYWYDIAWLRSAWTRPIKYDTWAEHLVLWQRGHFLGVSYRSWTSNYICEVDNRLYHPTGFVVTNSIYWDKLSTRKSLEKLKIWYKNVASSVGNIKIYAIVDDTYFWRFRPTSTPTKRPSIWDIYTVANNTTAKVIDVDKTNGVITFVTVSDTWSRANLANTSLTRVSWEWDATITVGYNFDNMCLIKTIESDSQSYGSDLIFGKNFVNNYIPYRYKIQLVIELNSNDSHLSPEVYEISMVSDITDVVL